MSVALVVYIDRSGRKGACKHYIVDDEDEFDFLDRVKSYLIDLKNSGGCILSIEVL